MLLILLIIGIVCHFVILKLLNEVFPYSEDEIFETRIISFFIVLFFLVLYFKVVLP